MKLAPSGEANTDSKRAVILFERLQAKAPAKGQYHTYKLCTSPSNLDLPIYKLAVPFLILVCQKNGLNLVVV